MTEPSRPSGVPSAARYEPNFRWVEGGFDEAGEKHGPYKSWADAGYLHNECTYLHGKVHGPNRVYQPDGSRASVGEWKDGVCYESTYFRPNGTSPEPFPTDVGENVVAVRFCTRDGRANYTTRYFDADEREVCDEGSAVLREELWAPSAMTVRPPCGAQDLLREVRRGRQAHRRDAGRLGRRPSRPRDGRLRDAVRGDARRRRVERETELIIELEDVSHVLSILYRPSPRVEARVTPQGARRRRGCRVSRSNTGKRDATSRGASSPSRMQETCTSQSVGAPGRQRPGLPDLC